MTEKELCLMCESYSEDTKCDHRDNCKLMAVLKENMELKEKVSQLKHQLDESELKRSYMINTNAIGDRHDMGLLVEMVEEMKNKLDDVLNLIQLYSYLLPTVKIGNAIMDFREKYTLSGLQERDKVEEYEK